MSDHSLAATLFGPRDLRMTEQTLAPLAPGMVRVRFGAGGICGSDMHYFRHARTGDFIVTSPLTLGHELSGTIAALGAGVSGLEVGQRVAVNPSRWCGTCPACRRGAKNLCANIYFMGSASKTPHMQGGFATEFDATPEQCVPVPSSVPFAAAALAEPLAVALHAVRRAGAMNGRRALIIGAGPIGQLIMLAALAEGASSVSMADIAAPPLAFARRLGAAATVDLSQGEAELAALEPFELVFEASGAPAGLAAAIRAAARGGTVIQIGNLPGGEVPIPANAVMAKELNLLGSFRFGDEFAEAVQMIADGRIDVTRIISAERALSEAPAALELALDRSQSMKVVLTA